MALLKGTKGRDGHRPQKTALLLAQRIVGEITDRGLGAGSSLPSEKAMLEQYAVARGTLRETLRFLEIQGVILMKTGPGGGPVVATPSSRPLASNIALLLQRTDTPFRAVVEARLTLEPALAAAAAERIGEEELTALNQSVEVMRDQINVLDVFLLENERFHSLIAFAGGNQIFISFIESLGWIFDATSLGVVYPEKARLAVCEEHARIYQALAAHNPEEAAESMLSHVRDFAEYMERKYSATLDSPLRWDQINWSSPHPEF